VNPKFQPHKLLLVFVLLYAILSVANNNGSIDIHLHDTYYIITSRIFYLVSALWLFLAWLITMLVQKLHVSIRLLWVYAILTIVSLLVLTGISVNYEFNTTDLETNRMIRSLQELSILLFIIANLLFIVNLAIGTFKSFRNKSPER
jgi:hypothetical protein